MTTENWKATCGYALKLLAINIALVLLITAEHTYANSLLRGGEAIKIVGKAIRGGQSAFTPVITNYDTAYVGADSTVLDILDNTRTVDRLEGVNLTKPDVSLESSVEYEEFTGLCKYRQFVQDMCELKGNFDTANEMLNSPRLSDAYLIALFEDYKNRIRTYSNYIDFSMFFAHCTVNTDVCECAAMLEAELGVACQTRQRISGQFMHLSEPFLHLNTLHSLQNSRLQYPNEKYLGSEITWTPTTSSYGVLVPSLPILLYRLPTSFMLYKDIHPNPSNQAYFRRAQTRCANAQTR